jgi:biofilm PGA synthesis N-glycosyltransferase PgaC
MGIDIALLLVLVLFAYPFVVYPVLLSWLAPARQAGPAAAPLEYPSVAFVICALNEEKIIRRKIENALAMQYPENRLRIVLVSDGSVDATAAIAREYTGPRLQLIERLQRRGKVANLNEVVASLSEEIVAFSDANVLYEPDALLKLIARLQDPTVGCVSGKVILTGTTEDLKQSEESYYSVEWKLQERASELYSMVGADGAMHAVRRSLFRPSPNDTLIEDLVMPVAVVRQGYRVVFEPGAVAWESGVASIPEEFRRKTRIAAGAAQGLLRGSVLPFGAPARFWFIFVSHKLLRWLSPFVGGLALVLALAAPDHLPSQAVLAGFAALSLLALLRLATGWTAVFLDAPFYFLFGQVALFWGLIKGAAGKQSVMWAKLNR